MNKPQCAQCRREFEWNHVYTQERTPGFFNVRVGEWLPRAFCPHCGALAFQGNMDRDTIQDGYKWCGDNADVNEGCPLPSRYQEFSGRPIPLNALPPISQDRIDVKRMRQLFIEDRRRLGVSEERILELAGEEPT